MYKKPSKQNLWEDHYSRKAKKENYPARSVYKLQEIQNKTRIIHKGDKVLDLGCSPGSWLLYAAQLTGENGQIIGIDLKPVSIKLPANVFAHVGDALSKDELSLKLSEKNFNVVLSDMAPDTTGQANTDVARSLRLAEAALSIALDVLIPGGCFVCKVFEGEGFKAFSDTVRACFAHNKLFKPQSSRKASREIYTIGLQKNRG